MNKSILGVGSLLLLLGCKTDGGEVVGDTEGDSETGADSTTDVGTSTGTGIGSDGGSTGPGTSTGSGSSGGEAEVECVAEPGVPGEQARVYYLNFNGGVLTFNPMADDAPTNQTPEQMLDGLELPPAGLTKSEISEVVAELQAAFSEFDVGFTCVRPEFGDYAMLMFTDIDIPNDPGGGGAIDCNDLNPNNIGFVFPENLPDAAATGRMAAQVMGKTLGLDETISPDDIMASMEPTAGARFIDTCVLLEVEATTPSCASEHDVLCPQGGQNARGELTLRMGNDPCGVCQYGSCLDESKTCDNDEDCRCFKLCVGGGDDDVTCQGTCGLTMNPPGFTDWVSCMMSSCQVECM